MLYKLLHGKIECNLNINLACNANVRLTRRHSFKLVKNSCNLNSKKIALLTVFMMYGMDLMMILFVPNLLVKFVRKLKSCNLSGNLKERSIIQ